MLSCEGYRMFYGTATVKWAATTPETVKGTWLYRPDVDCWYCNGHSYPADIVEVLHDLT